MTTIAQLNTSSPALPVQTAVIPTTVIHLPAWLALHFAEYLETEHLAETMLEQRVLDCALLKEPSEEFFLDQTLIGQVSSDAVAWLRERRCHRSPGCRVAQYEEAVMDDLLTGYQGGQWNRYAVVAASALEISIALELRECPCLLQLELVEAGYDGRSRSTV